jgi:hypothetical protein
MAANFYEILGLSRYATEAEIKKAFKELAKKYHPDKHPGQSFYEEHFKKINEAYQTLSDSKSRKVYDLRLFYNQVPSSHQSQQSTSQQTQQRPQQTYTQSTYRKTSAEKKQAAKVKLNKYYLYVSIIAILFIGGCYWFYNFMNAYAAKEYFIQGLKEESNGKLSLAKYYYSAALEKDNDNPEINEKVGDIYSKSGHNNSLELFYYDLELQKRNIDPDFDKTSKNMLAGIQVLDSAANFHFRKAYDHYEQINDKRRVGLKSIKSALKTTDYKTAQRNLNEVAKLSRHDDSTIYYQGEINFHLKNYTEARKSFAAFASLHPESIAALIRIALCRYNEGSEDLAIGQLNMVIKNFPDNGEAYYFKGEITRRQKEIVKACDLFMKADSLNIPAAKAAIYSYCSN